MALITKSSSSYLLSEEKHLKKGELGWTRKGSDVFTRCAHCSAIMRIADVRPNFSDGRGTCVTCAICEYCYVYIFAGMKSKKPHFKPGTYVILPGRAGRGPYCVDDRACPCGGTLVRMDTLPNSSGYCLSCCKLIKEV